MKEIKINNSQQQWININHNFYTIPEMADELKVEQIEIRKYCIRNNLQPITKGERAVAFIKKNPELTRDELAIELNMSASSIAELCKKHNLEYATKKRGRKRMYS